MRFPSVSLASLPRLHGLAAALLGVAAVAAPASRQGAYFPPAWGWSAFGLMLAAALALAFRACIDVDFLQWAFLGGIGLVLVWTALSAVWSDSIPRTVSEVERTLIYVAAIAAVSFAVSGATVVFMLGGVVAAVVGVSAYALLHQPSGHDQLNPLSGPLGYWNALGILDAFGVLLALGFVLSPGLPRAGRMGALLAVPVLATTLYLTYSRGSMAALGAGLLMFGLCHPWLSGRRLRLALAVLVTAAVAALATALALTGGASGLLGKTYAAFRSPPAPRGQPSQRILTLSGNFRPKYWSVAWREYESHPALGSGAGTFDLYWDRYRKTSYGSRDAHNLYLETLAEMGPIGLLLLAGTLVLPFVALRGGRRDPVLAAAGGAYLAFLLQAAVDWDWEMPAVTIAGLLCGGALIRARRGQRNLASPIRGVALASLAALGIFAAIAWRGNLATSASTDAAAHGHYRAALADAHTAARLMPWDSQPWTLAGVVQLALGHRSAAREDLRIAVTKDPQDWYPWYKLAQASTGSSRQQSMRQAKRLNPIGVIIARSAN
jgi:O-antigen ligase